MLSWVLLCYCTVVCRCATVSLCCCAFVFLCCATVPLCCCGVQGEYREYQAKQLAAKRACEQQVTGDTRWDELGHRLEQLEQRLQQMEEEWGAMVVSPLPSLHTGVLSCVCHGPSCV